MSAPTISAPIQTLKELYRAMVTARTMDTIEQSYTSRGEAFFHVSGAGHEGSVALYPHLRPEDWLHCHYRDKALMLARGITPRMFFYSLFNKDASHSRGRQMNAHMSSPKHNVLSIVGPVGNSALQAVGVAEVVKDRPGQPIVLCSLGEGMTQEGEVLEAIGHAVREQLPVLFLVQDNSFAISTKTTGKTFYSRPEGEADSFYGVPISRIDGRDVPAAYGEFGSIVDSLRSDRAPRIVVFSVDRLHSHTNADDHRMYRSPEEIDEIARVSDPITRLRESLLVDGTPREELDELDQAIAAELREDAREAQRAAEPQAWGDARRPLPESLTSADSEYLGTGERELTMLEAIRTVLDQRMRNDPSVTLFGEDIEDPKGDVFGITRGLGDTYGRRLRNSPLSESLIIGVSVGRALAGEHPVAFLQFADFLPIAYNQIFAEMGSMYWRTDGAWQVPMIVMVTAGGYRPGLGPFHASTLEAIAAHTPGIDVMMPSSAADAAGLLNAAFESKRPTIFFYPKNQLNDRSVATSTDIERHFVPVGHARTVRTGDDLTIVAYGNTVPLAEKAAAVLEEHGVGVDVIDLRSIVPWDISLVVASVEKTGRLIVVHEDNHTAGMGAEVIATVAERSRRAADVRRVTRPDTYVPCNFGNQLEILPSYKRILETAVELLGGTIIWKQDAESAAGIFDVEAIGSSPSDETVSVVEWVISVGDEVTEGDLLAEVEADKAAAELKSPVSGTVAELLVEQGDSVAVGTPVARLRTAEDDAPHVKPQTRENPGTPIISGISGDTGHKAQTAASSSIALADANRPVARLGAVAVRTGSRLVENSEIEALSPDWSATDIVKRTGIERRYWVDQGETALSLAVEASREILESSGLGVRDLAMIIFSTGTPSSTTPSMAALVQYELNKIFEPGECAAYDINAACSGYIYGLAQAYDYLSNAPNDLVLLVTSEVLSPRLDMHDAGTAPIFGDAATASLIGGAGATLPGGTGLAEIRRPVLAAKGESGETLAVPQDNAETISMDGPTVYLEAVKAMMETLEEAARRDGIKPDGLDLYIPHQANQRIINAIRQRMKLPRERMYSNIKDYGNTSSNTIPICLSELLQDRRPGEYWGLTAFGGGYTYAANLLKTL